MLIELIKVALGHQNNLNHIPTEDEWERTFHAARLQAVVGICFTSIQKLPIEQQPPKDLYWKWLGVVTQIQKQNELMDSRTAEVWQRLKDAGLDAAVLKGQGIAQEYGELAPFRQSGDIDIWVLGGYQKVCEYVQQEAPTTDLAYHRFHFNVFKDTEVELHHRPTLMRNLLDDRKLARWYNSFGADNFVYLEKKGFAVPPSAFNRIFILTHIYRHFLFEGIGLRQVMDYYFVLKEDGRWKMDDGRWKKEDVRGKMEDGMEILRSLRLLRFAKAMMWILHTQLGLEEQFLICGTDEKEGRFVLNEILTTGNFGQADQRYRYKHFQLIRQKLSHGAHLLLHYPSEVIWTPVWLVYHRYWKKVRKREIIRNYYFA